MKLRINTIFQSGSKFFGAITLAAVVAGCLSVRAQNIIGINFAGRQWSIGGNASQTLATADTAGVVSQENWNNLDPAGHDSGTQAQITDPNAGVISDNSGTATGLTLNYSAQGMWSVSQSVFTGNPQLMNGYSDVESDDSNIGVYAVSNINYAVYDVYVYISSDSNGRAVGVNLDGGPQYYLLTDANGYDYSNPLLQGAATSQVDATNAHYVYFQNVSGSGFEIDVHRYGGNAGVAGIQIMDTSEYSPMGVIHPTVEKLFSGNTAQFSVAATGTAPFTYQWRTNEVAITDGGNILGSTSNVLTLTDVTPANSGNYDVAITNDFGGTVTPAAQLTVVVPAAGSYEEAVVTNDPVAYYPFNESDGDPASTPNLPAFDYIRGANGVYGVPTLNLADSTYGPQPADGYPGFETGNGAVYFIAPGYPTSQISISAWGINTNTVTMVAWVYPTGTQMPNAGLIFNRGADVAGLGFTGTTNASGDYTLGYTWNNDPTTFFWNSGLVPPANQWSMVTLVVTPSKATIYLANTDGVSAAVHNYSHVVQSFNGPIAIGNDPSATDGSRVFNGALDEVAVYDKALTQDQVLGLFASASGVNNFPPHIASQPSAQEPFVGQNARFSVTAVGSGPLGYQWQAWTNGIYANLSDDARISGSQSPTLAINHVATSDPTNFVVIINSAYGSITSSPAAMKVTVNSYANTVMADGAVAYYALNETGSPNAGGLAAYDYLGGFDGIYGTDVQNGYSGVTGPRSTDGFSQFSTNNWAAQIIPNDANGHIVVSPWNLNTNTVTMTCWIHPSSVEPSYAGLIFSRGADGTQAGLNFSGNTDANGNRTLSYTWGNVCCWDSQLAPPTNQWSFLALVVSPTNATVYVFNTNGTSSASVSNTHDVLPFTGVTGIGLDPYNPSGRNFDGVIDEVAIFKQSLSASQLAQLYQSGVQLTSSWNEGNLTLNWAGGILLQSTNVTGPWTTNNSPSPLTVDPKTNGPQMFYRVQEQ